MTTHKNRKSLVAASGAALLAAALLAGCSSGGDLDAFCTDAAPIMDGSFLTDAMDPESADTGAMYDSALETVDKVDPPSDIKGDWETLSDALHTGFDAMGDLDPESETYAEDLEKVSADMDQDEITEAGTKVEEFFNENCEA